MLIRDNVKLEIVYIAFVTGLKRLNKALTDSVKICYEDITECIVKNSEICTDAFKHCVKNFCVAESRSERGNSLNKTCDVYVGEELIKHILNESVNLNLFLTCHLKNGGHESVDVFN